MQSMIQSSYDFIFSLTLVLPRILICLSIVPIFNFTKLPKILRTTFCIGIVLPVAYIQSHIVVDNSIQIPHLIFIFLKEAFIGLAMGLFYASPFWVFQSVGAYVDNQRGALSGGYMNPAAGPDSSMIGELLLKVLIISFMELGLVAYVIGDILTSYSIWQVTEFFPVDVISSKYLLIDAFNEMAVKYVLYSGPVVLILLFIETAFGILGAYSPQLQVYFMAMPAKSIVAIAVLVLYINYMHPILNIEIDYLKGVSNYIGVLLNNE